jgi:hypothetical protein
MEIEYKSVHPTHQFDELNVGDIFKEIDLGHYDYNPFSMKLSEGDTNNAMDIESWTIYTIRPNRNVINYESTLTIMV